MGLKMHHNKDMYTIAQIENDLRALHDYCMQMNLAHEDIVKLYEPLTLSAKKAKFLRKIRRFLIFLAIVSIIYASSYFELFSWHYSAIGRLALIKVLPFWNWQPLKNEKCMLTNNFVEQHPLHQTECTFCEAIDKVPMELFADPEIIRNNYINLNVPVIVIDDFEHWPIGETHNLSRLSEVFYDEEYFRSRPCKISSNIINSEETTDKILMKTERFDRYFLHFQNCDFEAVKRFRKFTGRPEFLGDISPVQYSWLLVSRHYNVSKFKPVPLRDRTAVVCQVLGSNVFRLNSVRDCQNDCPVLEIELKVGEILILTSLWDLEYLPTPDSENLTIILEFH